MAILLYFIMLLYFVSYYLYSNVYGFTLFVAILCCHTIDWDIFLRYWCLSQIYYYYIIIIMQNTSIQCVKSTKFLGVIIDNKLRWNDHITYVKNKISKSLGILYKIRRYLDNTTLTNMYYSFVFPYLIYCVEIWGSSLKSYLDPLVKIQKKCI